eukprot:351877-Chlamydomonas_euryale.AAC.6
MEGEWKAVMQGPHTAGLARPWAYASSCRQTQTTTNVHRGLHDGPAPHLSHRVPRQVQQLAQQQLAVVLCMSWRVACKTRAPHVRQRATHQPHLRARPGVCGGVRAGGKRPEIAGVGVGGRPGTGRGTRSLKADAQNFLKVRDHAAQTGQAVSASWEEAQAY